MPGVAACWAPKCSMPCPPAWCCAAGACRGEEVAGRPSGALEVTGVSETAADRYVGHSRPRALLEALLVHEEPQPPAKRVSPPGALGFMQALSSVVQ